MGLGPLWGMTMCVPEGEGNAKVISLHCLITVVWRMCI